MAKWGEGDPRWLVEERPDATNVNNWHWKDKNASHWSKNKFTELFVGAKIETDSGKCEITEISKCEGEASVNNRKAKLIFLYDWVIEMKWNGALKNGETDVKGTIKVPNLGDEHEIKDVDVLILLDTAGPESDVLNNVMRSAGTEIIRQKLSLYVATLKEEFSKGVILPTKDPSNTEVVQTEKLNKINELKALGQSSIKNSSFTGKVETTELKSTESFKCSAEEFYRAMTIKELVEAFTRGSCLLEPEEGGRFELFEGRVQGHFVKLEPDKKIVQKWRFKTWPEGHYSRVVINIEQKMDSTDVCVEQYGIPKTHIESTREGWKRFYWDGMKRTFGFGALLFK